MASEARNHLMSVIVHLSRWRRRSTNYKEWMGGGRIRDGAGRKGIIPFFRARFAILIPASFLMLVCEWLCAPPGCTQVGSISLWCRSNHGSWRILCA